MEEIGERNSAISGTMYRFYRRRWRGGCALGVEEGQRQQQGPSDCAEAAGEARGPETTALLFIITGDAGRVGGWE